MVSTDDPRRSPLKDFLATRLQGARRYDRIAGFFSSSLLEVAGEALERMAPEAGETCTRVVCNSRLNPLDVQTARAAKWGIIERGLFHRLNREALKRRITTGELRLAIGTDAASEGLNLQRLGTLINLDLPWNPTRLEQRKGRIQRIGQLRPIPLK